MSKRFNNSLAYESSLYLLQHAHNPVDWHPWNEEVLIKAQSEDKPILLSIGYSSCHWCHVMEKESFEDEEVASFMNQYFINIKVDREERPDLDHVYMEAVQLITGSGGWPLNIFLTPDAKPFWGGTYFPPEPRYRKPSWKNVLESVHNWWMQDREKVMKQAADLADHINNQHLNVETPNDMETADSEIFQFARGQFMKMADTRYGGFGQPPKFPHFAIIDFLLVYGQNFHDEEALDHALFTLRRMLDGGIYDQIGGGISRYSTDEKWLIPHFEKMLYDNALLISTLSVAYRITRQNWLLERLQQTVDFCLKHLYRNEGMFASIDADSQDGEGVYYTWTKRQIAEVAGEDTELICAYYGITEPGNWENGLNILQKAIEADQLVSCSLLSTSETIEKIKIISAQLLLVRDNRIPPVTDEKQILSWNAMFITALTQAFESTGNPEFRARAVSLFNFLEQKFFIQGRPGHHYCNGQRSGFLFMDDLAYLIQAAIQLNRVTADRSYIDHAYSLAKLAIAEYYVDTSGFFYFTSANQNSHFRKIDLYDGAYPSSNSIMLSNLSYLTEIFADPGFPAIVRRLKSNIHKGLLTHPLAYSGWFNGILSTMENRPVMKLPSALSEALWNFLQSCPMYGLIIVYNDEVGKVGKIEYCFDQKCLKPLNNFEELRELLANHPI